jgi:hypothetical protein
MTANGLPDQLLRMPGVSQYYVSGYAAPAIMPDEKTVGAQMVVARSKGVTTKNYNYYLATTQMVECISRALKRVLVTMCFPVRVSNYVSFRNSVSS